MAELWPAGWNRPGAQPTSAAPLILSAALPPALQTAADAARSRLYPQGAARAPAHLGLFRHLPGPMADEIRRTIATEMAYAEAPMMSVRPARWKNGILFLPVETPALDRLRDDLAGRWHGLLAPGDIAPPALHITLAGARAPKPRPADPTPAFAPGPWRCPGLLLWRVGGYGEACWRPLVAWRFRQ